MKREANLAVWAEQVRAWDAKHYKQLSCKVQMEIGTSFQEMCEKSGITANNALVSVVEKCVNDPEAFEVILQWAKERPVKPFRPKSSPDPDVP